MPLEAGEAAPFAGQLFPADRAIKLGQKVERCEYLRKQDVQKLDEMCDLNLELEEQKRKVAIEAAGIRERMLREEYRRAWYEHPVIVAIVSILGTYAILRAAKGLP